MSASTSTSGEMVGLRYFPQSTLICNPGQVDGKGATGRIGAGRCLERIPATLLPHSSSTTMKISTSARTIDPFNADVYVHA